MKSVPKATHQGICQSLKRYSEIGVVTGIAVKDLAKVFDVEEEVVRAVAGMEGVQVYSEPTKSRVKKARTDPTARAAIKNMSIFKCLGNRHDDEATVVTTVGQLKRERREILKWIEDARDGLA